MSIAQQTKYKELIEDLKNPKIQSTLKHLTEILDCSERTVKRKLKDLREHGYTISSKPCYDDNGRKFSQYFIDEDTNVELPELPFVLSENSYLAFVFMQRVLNEFTNTPFEKETIGLIQKVKEQVFSRSEETVSAVKLISEHITAMKPILPKIKENIWPSLIEAVENVQQVSFNYMKMDTTIKEYTVNPYHLFLSDINFQNSWYLAGFVEEKNEFRVFNLSRVRDVSILAGDFFTSKRKHPYPFTKISDILWNTNFQNSEEDAMDFVIEINREVLMSLYSTSWNLGETYKELDNGNYEMRFRTRLTHNVRSWIMSWGKFVTIHEPQLLKDQIKEHIAEMLKKL